MSEKSRPKALHFPPPSPGARIDHAVVNRLSSQALACLGRAVRAAMTAALLLAWPLLAHAAEGALAERVRTFAQQAVAGQPAGVRVEVELGTLDPRLRLAPCDRVTPYLPAHARLWGATRIGIRCDEGARWSVFLPLRVKVFARGSTPAVDLPAGAVLQADQLVEIEVDLAGDVSPAVRRADDAIGRALVRPVRRGQSLRQADLKPRQWFAPGDTVRVLASGAGFSIVAEGQALTAGVEGQGAKVRIEGGRIVTGRASGQRQVEVTL